jgi:hypothetical protein
MITNSSRRMILIQKYEFLILEYILPPYHGLVLNKFKSKRAYSRRSRKHQGWWLVVSSKVLTIAWEFVFR